MGFVILQNINIRLSYSLQQGLNLHSQSVLVSGALHYLVLRSEDMLWTGIYMGWSRYTGTSETLMMVLEMVTKILIPCTRYLHNLIDVNVGECLDEKQLF